MIEAKEVIVAVFALLSMIGAALLALFSKASWPAGPLQDDTRLQIRLVANLFVVMTSLVLGFMINSARNTHDTNNRNLRALATDIILLDRTVRGLGPEATDIHRYLVEYLQTALKKAQIWEDPKAEALLNAAGTSLRAIRVSDEQKVMLWNDAILLYREVIRERWVLVDTAGGTIPTPVIIMLILWLTLIFASFGYRAPRNTTVTASLLLAALLISATLYLIFDMDTSSSFMFAVSKDPYRRALAQMERPVD
jgi:hypothetical protein